MRMIMRKMKVNKKNKRRSKARIIRSVCFNKEVDSEKHRELIMLFTPWRNETTDLIKQYSSYEQHYLQVKNIIDDQMKFYAICSKNMNDIQEQLNNMDDDDKNFDLVAPGTQDIERQDESETFIQNSTKAMTYLVILEYLQLLLILSS